MRHEISNGNGRKSCPSSTEKSAVPEYGTYWRVAKDNLVPCAGAFPGRGKGYSILKEIETRSGGRVKLSTGTLYAAIKRLLAGVLTEETQARPEPKNDDARRRYYALTPLGRHVARAETERMADLATLAATKDLTPAREVGHGGKRE